MHYAGEEAGDDVGGDESDHDGHAELAQQQEADAHLVHCILHYILHSLVIYLVSRKQRPTMSVATRLAIITVGTALCAFSPHCPSELPSGQSTCST